MLRRTGVTPSLVLKRFNHRINTQPNPEKAKAYLSFEEHSTEHAVKTTHLWKYISLGTLPVLIACAWYVYPKEKHHIHHLEELVALPNDQWPPEMDYQNIRTHKFFWGDGQKSLFWGPTNHSSKE